jgi:hypothetical protein
MGIENENLNHDDIDSYRESIIEWAKERKPIVFPNKGSQHAAIVIGQIFNEAKDIVRIYAKNMNGDISEFQDYRFGIENFLNCNTNRLKVLLDEKPNPESSTLMFILNKAKQENNNISVKFASSEFRGKLEAIRKNSNDKLHFTIGDNSMVRIETNDETHEAKFCSFNKPSTAQPLAEFFDYYFEGSKEYK